MGFYHFLVGKNENEKSNQAHLLSMVSCNASPNHTMIAL